MRDARDAGIDRVQDAVAAGQPLCGFEVDDATRGVIQKAASASTSPIAPATPSAMEVHGNGANMDNFENSR